MDTPPDHVAPSAEVKESTRLVPGRKAQRYDRQLRLWGQFGQTALEASHILVVNATATAASILKNLVLPGIGSFTLLDDKPVTAADLGNNFFLSPGDSLEGSCRAYEVSKYLSELNDGVKSHFLNQVSAGQRRVCVTS